MDRFFCTNVEYMTMTETGRLVVRTIQFGDLEVPEEKILRFDEGIPGFPNIRRFAMLELENLKPFSYLQSLEDPPIALLVVNPFFFCPSYTFELGETDTGSLRADKPEDVSVFVVANIPDNPSDATINLMAPLLIHAKNRLGRQVILLDSQYSVRHPLFPSAETSGAG
jgi:flagellar assembly factor FliW